MNPQSLMESSITLLRSSGTIVGSLVMLIGMLAVTAWNVTRSDHLSQAQHSYARGELPDCLQHALDHLERCPWSREATLLAARSLSQLDYANAAEVYYQHAGDLDISDAQTRAFGLVRGNQRKQAIEAYERILARWPDNVTALRRLAAVQLSQNDFPQLEALAIRLIQAPGGAAVGYTLRGVVAHSDHNYEGAVDAFEHVLELDPDLRVMPLPRMNFWSHLAEDLIKCGRNEDAGKYLTKVLAETPDASLLNTLGRAYLLQGMLDEAEHCYQQAAEWEPNNYIPHYNLGKIELQRHRPEQAVKHFEVAQKLVSRQGDVLQSLATTYRLLGRPADVAHVQRLIKEVRDRSKVTRSPKDPWPPYAL
jgi:tetratricopeptide (TPR) repeat protein